MKNQIALIFLVLGIQMTHAQDVRELLNDRFEVVTSLNESRYFRTVKKIDNHLFDVEVHYNSGGMKMKGQYLIADKWLEHGHFEYYYRNGKLESQGDYKYGKKVGSWERYNWDGTRKGDRWYPDTEEEVVTIEQSPASFPNGYGAMLRYIDANAEYPISAMQNGIEGTVKVSFKINPDGTLADLNVVESVHPLIDSEAVRLVRTMPQWLPARRNGEAVPSTFIMPIHFKIDQGEPMVYIGNEL